MHGLSVVSFVDRSVFLGTIGKEQHGGKSGGWHARGKKRGYAGKTVNNNGHPPNPPSIFRVGDDHNFY
jgi:hypothetical protein